jgi:hypothetical protein
MGRILDTLKWVELARRKLTRGKTTGTATQRERRQTPRIYIEIPLFVYGYTPRGDPFYEEACSIAINARGALISMQSAVWARQQLLITNEGNDQTQQCVVVSAGVRPGHSFDVAFQFPIPMPQFWRNVEIGKPLLRLH